MKNKKTIEPAFNNNEIQDLDENPWWKQKRTKNISSVVGAICIIAIVMWWFLIHPYISTDDARVDADIIRVANQGAGLRIEKVFVEEGSIITRGTLLVELDRRIAEAQLDRARARARLAELDLKRAEILASQKGLSQQQLDKSRAEALTAGAEFRLAEIALDNTYIKSPVDGIIVQKLAKPGNILETSQVGITVVDIQHAWIAANIEETEISKVIAGQKVYISVDEGGSLTGKVIDVRSASAAQFALIPPDNAQGNFIKLVQRIPVKIALDPHPGRTLRVGQSVEIKIRVR